MLPWFAEQHANPTAAHRSGRRARQALDEARSVVAEATGFERGEIVFTGGGTESDNMAIGRGHPAGTVVVGATEHPAVREPARRQEAAIAAVDSDGLVSVASVMAHVTEKTEIVSVMAVNNELGVVQPVADIADAVHAVAPDALVHTDAVQALPWLDLVELLRGIDVASVSAHKVGGPQGVGAVAIRTGRAPEPLLVGGGQERDHRAGTQNVAGIVGFAAALRASIDDRVERVARIERLADRLFDGLQQATTGIKPTVPRDRRVPGIIHVCIEGVASEPLLFLLDEQNLACSAASSCASGAQGASHVLGAMGIDTTGMAPLRLSLGWSTTDADVDAALRIIPRAIDSIRERSGG